MPYEKEITSKLFDLQKRIPGFAIDYAKRAALCFRESLIICSKDASNGKPIGSYCVLVESLGPEEREFLVHVQSSMSIDGHFGGTKVISSATAKFHCLEEKRTEFVYEDGLHEKTIFLGIQDNYYHVKLTRSCPCDTSTESRELSFQHSNNLISEGVNVLLMRYLALVDYEGTLLFTSMSIDGELMKNIYTCTCAERMHLDGHFLDVYTIERKMVKEDGNVCNTVRTYLTQNGKIIRHNWLDVPYLLKINPLTDPKSPLPPAAIKIETPLRDRWMEDIEMFSKYLDMKSSKIAEHTEYLTDHPEVKRMIADYVQTLLVGNQSTDPRNIVPILLKQVRLTRFLIIDKSYNLRVKPENVIDFTIQHFKAFARDPIAWETSASKEDSDADLTSQLSESKSGGAVVCGVCGFCLDHGAIEKFSSTSFMEQEEDDTNLFDESLKSVCSSGDSGDEAATDSAREKDKSSSTDAAESVSKLKKTCDQCQAIIKFCENHKSRSKCPGCLKISRKCFKCTAVDEILKKFKQ